MPYPSQVNREQIVEAAREFIKDESADAMTLSKLARKLGVKAPSLYRHVANKEALLQLVNLVTLQEMATAVALADDSSSPPLIRLSQVVKAYRQYAHANPELYILAMTAKPGEGRPDQHILVEIVLPMQALVAEISGEENSLTALRGLLALIHGYIMLELNQQLQRGGNLDEAFEDIVVTYLNGWA